MSLSDASNPIHPMILSSTHSSAESSLFTLVQTRFSRWLYLSFCGGSDPQICQTYPIQLLLFVTTIFPSSPYSFLVILEEGQFQEKLFKNLQFTMNKNQFAHFLKMLKSALSNTRFEETSSQAPRCAS